MEGLRKAVVEGHIDSMASDHSPCPPDLKALDAGDFPKAWGGISGMPWQACWVPSAVACLWHTSQKAGTLSGRAAIWPAWHMGGAAGERPVA